MCVPHFLYPFICQWTFRFFPCLGYFEYFGKEHESTGYLFKILIRILDKYPQVGLLDHITKRVDLMLSVFTAHKKNNDEGRRKLQEAWPWMVVTVSWMCIYLQTQ